jgi:hypothetical protein
MGRYGLHFTGVPGAVDAEFLAGGMFELERGEPEALFQELRKGGPR